MKRNFSLGAPGHGYIAAMRSDDCFHHGKTESAASHGTIARAFSAPERLKHMEDLPVVQTRPLLANAKDCVTILARRRDFNRSASDSGPAIQGAAIIRCSGPGRRVPLIALTGRVIPLSP